MKTLQESILGNVDKQIEEIDKEIEISKFFDNDAYVDAWIELFDKLEKSKKGTEIKHINGTGMYLIITKIRFDRTIDILLIDNSTENKYDIDLGAAALNIQGNDYKIITIDQCAYANEDDWYGYNTKLSDCDFKYVMKITDKKEFYYWLHEMNKYITKHNLI